MNSTIKGPKNSGIHIDHWVDGENIIHTFYEPIYPGQPNLNSFTDHLGTNETPAAEEENEEAPPTELPY